MERYQIVSFRVSKSALKNVPVFCGKLFWKAREKHHLDANHDRRAPTSVARSNPRNEVSARPSYSIEQELKRAGESHEGGHDHP